MVIRDLSNIRNKNTVVKGNEDEDGDTNNALESGRRYGEVVTNGSIHLASLL